MSMILSDSNGYVCELESAVESTALLNWLKRAGSPEIEVFCENHVSEFPEQLADEIEALMLRDKPSNQMVDIVETTLIGLRRCKNFVVLEM